MSYIGSKPADAVLETDDIADGVVTTSKLADDSVTNPKLFTGSQQNFRNIIINGDMSIAQRGTSTASITNSGYYTVDRWRTGIDTGGTWTISQDTDVPTGQGFAKSMKFDCTTANASLSANSVFFLSQRLEGQNLQYLKKGTANAESVTMSFWVRSNKTGTYICELSDNDNTRHIAKSYTISIADTWEKKTLTFAGDTTGAFDNDNARSLDLYFWLGAGTDFTSGTLSTTWTASTAANRAVGQVNLADNTANDWYITGVQLEVGTSASDFEFLPYDVNLNRCQRYYYRINPNGTSGSIGSASYYISTAAFTSLNFPTSMRTSPSLETVTGISYYAINRDGDNDFFNDFSLNDSNIDSADLYTDSNLSSTSGYAGRTRFASASGYVAFTSEL
jgi:hypothetical protein